MILRRLLWIIIWSINVFGLELDLNKLEQNLQKLSDYLGTLPPSQPTEKRKAVAALDRVISNLKDIWGKADRDETGWDLTEEQILDKAFRYPDLKKDWLTQDFSEFDDESREKWEDVGREFGRAKESIETAHKLIVDRQQGLQSAIDFINKLDIQAEVKWLPSSFPEKDWFEFSPGLEIFDDIVARYESHRGNFYLDLVGARKVADANIFKSKEEREKAKELIDALDKKWEKIQQALKRQQSLEFVLKQIGTLDAESEASKNLDDQRDWKNSLHVFDDLVSQYKQIDRNVTRNDFFIALSKAKTNPTETTIFQINSERGLAKQLQDALDVKWAEIQNAAKKIK